MSYLTSKTFKNNPLYLAIFLPMLLVGQVTTIVSAHGAELEMRRLDDGRGSLQKNMEMSGSELESFRLDRKNLGVRLEDGLNQINRPSLDSELESHQMDTTNLGASLGLSPIDRIRLNSELEAVRMETEVLGYRVDESDTTDSGILVETKWIIMDPPLRTEEISFYDRESKSKVTKAWGELKNEEIVRLLSNTTAEVNIDKIDAEAKIGFLPFVSSTGGMGKYKVVMDYTPYIIEDALNKAGKLIGHARVGIGLRVIAEVKTKKANIDLSGLPALSAAVKANQLSGRMSVMKIGISPKNDIGTMITNTTIDPESISRTLETLAVLKSKISDESTHLDPQILSVKPIPYKVKPLIQPKRAW